MTSILSSCGSITNEEIIPEISIQESNDLPKIPDLPPEEEKIENMFLECGMDIDCFIKSAKSCSPAHMTYTENSDMSFMGDLYSMFSSKTIKDLKLNRGKNNECTLVMTTTDFQVNINSSFQGDITDDILEKQKKAENLIKKSILVSPTETCTSNAEELELFMNKLKIGKTYNDKDYIKAGCI